MVKNIILFSLILNESSNGDKNQLIKNDYIIGLITLLLSSVTLNTPKVSLRLESAIYFLICKNKLLFFKLN